MEEILWPSFFGDTVVEENKSKDIISTQAKALKKITNGLVGATFSKVIIKEVNNNNVFEGAGKLLNYIATSKVEVVEHELEGKKDVNVFFHSETYKFEIYNDQYRFRVFILRYNILYPIRLEIDEDIASELSIGYFQEINSNFELTQLLKKIFTSKKINTIISYIMMREK